MRQLPFYQQRNSIGINGFKPRSMQEIARNQPQRGAEITTVIDRTDRAFPPMRQKAQMRRMDGAVIVGSRTKWSET
jgi:hypothetical protein